MNNLTRSRYTELLELLEISQLMDTTVRNGYYDEALELIEFARKLGKVTKSYYLKTNTMYAWAILYIAYITLIDNMRIKSLL